MNRSDGMIAVSSAPRLWLSPATAAPLSTCANCHSVGGLGPQPAFAPDLAHLAERGTLATGVLDNSPANLFRWLKNPQAFKPACLMPNLDLTDQQAQELTAFLEPQPH